MSTTTDRTAPAGAPRLGGLLRSEVRRATSRRALVWLSVLATLAVLGVATIMWFTSAAVDAGDLRAATEQFRAEQLQYYEQCLADPAIPESEKANACWRPTEQEIVDNAIWALPKRPFSADTFDGLLVFTGAIGTLAAIMLAASAGGADWAARTMGLLLSWEPRRMRVFLVRMLVSMVIGTLVVAWLAALALALGAAIASAHGLSDELLPVLGAQFRPVALDEGLELALRWLPVAGLAAAGGFGLAMLTRSTGWAIGVAIGLVAIVESIIQNLWAWGSQWLIQTNLAAWLQGGVQWRVDRNPVTYSAAPLAPGVEPGTIFITDTRALAWLATLALGTALVSLVAFLRRDVE
jgi:ABC-2 type transport system permease protein